MACLVAQAMRAADRQRHLPGVLGLARDGRQQERPGSDGFAMMLWIGQTHEQTPPVVDQRYHPGEQPAACQVLCREAAPSPLILQFIKHVFTVSSIPIQLPEGQDFAIERGDQGGVFPNRFVGPDLGKRQPRLRGVRLFGDRQITGQLAAQQDDAALAAPAE